MAKHDAQLRTPHLTQNGARLPRQGGAATWGRLTGRRLLAESWDKPAAWQFRSGKSF